MKTLDEVITALEDEGVFPDALHYLKEYKIKRERIMAKAQDCEDTEKRLQDEIARYQEAVRNCEIAENKYKKLVQDLATVDLPDGDHQQLEKARTLLQDFYRNDPLTWDELRTMEGKPVWMEDDTGTKFYRGWAIVLDFEVANGNYLHYECDDYSETCVDVEDIGKTWNAYRKERK